MVNFTFQVQISESMCEESADVTFPQVSKQFVARFADGPLLVALAENVGVIVDGPVPQFSEEIGEVVVLFPQERVQQRIDEQIVDVPARHPAGKQIVKCTSAADGGGGVGGGAHLGAYRGTDRRCARASLSLEEIIKVVSLKPQKQISEKTCARNVEITVSHVVEQIIEMPESSSQDRILERD